MKKAKRGGLNILSALIDQGLVMVVSFIVTPVVVSHLGSSLYGLWQTFQKTATQIGMLNGRSSEVLKWRLAQDNQLDNDSEKRRQIGAALTCFCRFLPLLIMLIVALVVFAPLMAQAASLSPTQIRLIAGVLGFNILLTSASEFFEAILRGMNRGYLRMGLRGTIVAIGGIASYLAVVNGFGVPTLCLIMASMTLATALSIFLVIRKHFHWLGVERPKEGELKPVITQSLWFTSWGFLNTAFLTADIMILGYFMDSRVVALYNLTKYLPLFIPMISFTVYSAILPGMAGELGKGNLAKINMLRDEAGGVVRWIAGGVCMTILILNQTFVSLWVGSEHFLGFWENVLIVVATYQMVMIRQDTAFLNLLLSVRAKVVFGGLGLSLLLILAWILIPHFGALGMCIAVVISRLFLMISYPRIIHKSIESPARPLSAHLREWLAPVAIFAVGTCLAAFLPVVHNWFQIALASIPTFFLTLLIGYWVLIDSSVRRSFRSRIASLTS